MHRNSKTDHNIVNLYYWWLITHTTLKPMQQSLPEFNTILMSITALGEVSEPLHESGTSSLGRRSSREGFGRINQKHEM